MFKCLGTKTIGETKLKKRDLVAPTLAHQNRNQNWAALPQLLEHIASTLTYHKSDCRRLHVVIEYDLPLYVTYPLRVGTKELGD